MKHKSKRLMLLSLVFAATMLTGCASSRPSVIPTQTWQPAAVNEVILQTWRSEVKNYSSELTRILDQGNSDL